MNNSVEIQLEFNDDEVSVEKIKDFFATFARVHINKAEPKTAKSWDSTIEIFLTIIGTWAAERYVLDPLAEKADEWVKGIKTFWESTSFQRPVNVIVKFVQDKNNLEIQLIGNYQPDALKQVWQIIKNIIQLLQTQNFQLDKIRILSNSDKSLLIIGYAGNQPKYTINLNTKKILPIKKFSNKDGSEYNPEVELMQIILLERQLGYLKFIQQNNYDVSDIKLVNLETEIQNKKDKLSL